MAKMRIIMVGGFLGAGKTTLLAKAARHLRGQGRRVGIITNDQAADLVDTKILAGSGVGVEEIPAGCFCCRFEDLERTANRLFRDLRPDVLLSEPVGSCTDISAAVLQPMKKHWGEWAEISPFSVLADPRRLRQVFDSRDSSFPESVRYIIKKQFEEADYIVLNKTDLLYPEELAALRREASSAWPDAELVEMSALKDLGVVEWLDMVMSVPHGGDRIVEVDYDLYASGEAQLGWLNTCVSLTAHRQTNWKAFAGEVIGRIHGELAGISAEIGHLKLLISDSTGMIVANATSIAQKPEVQGGIGEAATPVTLMINARAHVEPQVLKTIVERSIIAVAGKAVGVSELNLHSFKPAYPRPTYRIDRVISQS
jgi:Ni2+-binding GTPase involved in maturation of urease and hydrogenase